MRSNFVMTITDRKGARCLYMRLLGPWVGSIHISGTRQGPLVAGVGLHRHSYGEVGERCQRECIV